MVLHIISYSKLRKESRPLAMGLVVVGAALGMYLNFYFGNIGWNNFLMFCALLLLPNWRNVFNMKLPSANRTLINITLFQFFCLGYAVIGKELDSGGMIYILFTIFLIYGIMTHNKGDMSVPRVVLYAWLFGWICVAFCSICLATGDFFIEDLRTHDGSGYQSVLVDLTMSGNLYIFIVCSLYYIDDDSQRKYYAIFGIVLALILIIVLGKRTPLLVSLAVIGFYYLKFHPISRKVSKSTLGFVLFILLLIVVLIQIPGFFDKVLQIWDRTIGGILDMIHGTSSTGMAAVERYRLRQWALQYIDNDFTLLNYIFGAGYMTMWLDAPLLQAYLDMGIIGFSYYLYYVIIKPLIISFTRIASDHLVFWGCALNYYNIFSAMNSGTPYGHVRWVPFILLVLAIMFEKTIGKKKTIVTI